MATDLHSTTEPSMTSLVAGILNDAQSLVRQEAALARREFMDEFAKAKQAAVSLGIGAGIAVLGGWLLILMIVYLLNEEAQLRLWLSYGIVGGILLVAGIGLLFFAKAKARDVNLVPKQTVQTLKEDMQWIKDRT
jgi:hypothetical protein